VPARLTLRAKAWDLGNLSVGHYGPPAHVPERVVTGFCEKIMRKQKARWRFLLTHHALEPARPIPMDFQHALFTGE
jgi:hypothetical protein